MSQEQPSRPTEIDPDEEGSVISDAGEQEINQPGEQQQKPAVCEDVFCDMLTVEHAHLKPAHQEPRAEPVVGHSSREPKGYLVVKEFEAVKAQHEAQKTEESAKAKGG